MVKVSPPVTDVGVNRSVVVPSPSWPRVFTPQQYAVLPKVSPHVCAWPTARLVKASEDASRGRIIPVEPVWSSDSGPVLGVTVLVAVPDARGFAVAVAKAGKVMVADALADGVADVVADATRVGVAVCSAWPDAAGGGSNPHRSPATTRTGTTIRLTNGRMRVSIVQWISDNSLGLYLPNPIPTE